MSFRCTLSRGTSTALALSFAFLLFLATDVVGQSSELFLIDFELYAEGTEIDDEYSSLGVTFSIAGDPLASPIIAVEGPPTVGFTGSGADSPMSSGSGGLTDPVVGGDVGVAGNIVMTFSPPVTSARFFVIDLEAAETATALAYDGVDEVDSDTHSAGEAGTGNGVSTEFFVSAPSITSIVLEVSDPIGYAVDFLTFTRPCTTDCGTLIRLSQESAPGVGDFDTHVLGYLLSYPSISTASSYYAYGVPEGSSWNGQSLTPIVDRSHLLLAETEEGRTLIFVHDRAIPDDPDGGRAEIRVEIFGDSDGAVRTVEDDPPSLGDTYTGSPGDLVFTAENEWSPCCTDGFAISGIDDEAELIVAFTNVDGSTGTATIAGMTEWVAYSAEGTEIVLALEPDRRVHLALLPPTCSTPFIRGDCNVDGEFEVSDAVAMLGVLFGSLGSFACDDACDANDDEALEISDAVWMLSYLFVGGPTPAQPFPNCGVDLSVGDICCEFYAGCVP